jgi:ribonuclease HII
LDIDLKYLQLKIGLCSYSSQLIDKLNILEAALGAMGDAIQAVADKQVGPGMGWVDGNKLPRQTVSNLNLGPQVKGDANFLLIGLASIIAKEWRDQWMEIADQFWPQYGLKKHAGYPTAQHLNAIQQFGPISIHRRTFKGVSQPSA